MTLIDTLFRLSCASGELPFLVLVLVSYGVFFWLMIIFFICWIGEINRRRTAGKRG